MLKDKIIKRVKIRKIKQEHLAQFNDLLRYAFQVTKQDLVDVGWEEDEIKQSKSPILEKADVLGWFDGKKLISQIAVYPMKINIHGTIYDMGGVTGVATYPEYANLGLMHQIMIQSLTDMKEKQQSISFLYPYSIPFYRRKGWEIVSDKMSFTIKDFQLPKQVEVSGMVERVDLQHDDICCIYEQFSQLRHGALQRDKLAWEEYWRWDVEDMIAAVYYDNNHVPTGYIFYWLVNDVFHIKDIVYLNEEARKGIWNYISAHFSMVTEVQGNNFSNEPLAFLLEDSEIVEKIRPFYMARIVDVEDFLSKYPFAICSPANKVTFVLEDPLLAWNEGAFTLQWDDQGQTILSHDEGDDPVILSIQTLTTMLLSYRRPSYLHKIERIQASKKMIRLLESIIPLEQPYFSDYF